VCSRKPRKVAIGNNCLEITLVHYAHKRNLNYVWLYLHHPSNNRWNF